MEIMRRAGNRGKFYPFNCSDIHLLFKQFEIEHRASGTENKPGIIPRAIIAPHAGYIYSGFTAYTAYKILSKATPQRVFVIGPSHHHYFEGISAAFFKQYETPCGNLEIDTGYLNKLNIRFQFLFHKKAHYHEHSTETQMPFIKHFLPQTKIVELIYGKVDQNEVSEIIEMILSDKHNVIVISSDLSHFYPLNQAEILDKICLDAIAEQNIHDFDKGCEACGTTGIKAITDVSKRLKLNSKIIDYRTSAHASGDNRSVVGYASAVYWQLNFRKPT